MNDSMAKSAPAFTLLALTLGMLGCSSTPAVKQATFPTAEGACQALVVALRSHEETRLLQILGPEGEELVSSGDEVADQNSVTKFLKVYDEQHSLATQSDGSVILQIGKDDWPFPIPIVQDGSGWRFDTEAGKDEILSRRIGRNETAVIEVCLAIVDAQREYAQRDPDGDGVCAYAQKFLSDPGKKNGLYWETAEGGEESPLGPLVATATEEGYTVGVSAPYHGYRYRMLKSQGEHAQGGAYDYMVGSEMMGGFAVVAYPAEYANSGVMTFIVNHEGVVYQRDLGLDTEKIAKDMTTFDPGPGWERCHPSDEAPSPPDQH
jgi:hypothetical protein